MSYQVLARKWRPQTFDDVVGQDAVVQTLKRALSTDRVAHAFLFCGSRGIGKTTLARLMAKALCCEKGVTADPDGTCVHCTEIAKGSSVDVVEIDGASNTSVDDVRELREATRFQPQSARFRVFIIDEVHMLSTNAFNALLKTLEEPPPHVKFVFATTESHKIPVTILSRCQRYDFKRISTESIVGRLQYVLGEEKVELSAPALRVIARAAQGGMRDALSLTDQVLSFSGPGATVEQVTEALGLIDRRSIVQATFGIVDRDSKTTLTIADDAYRQGHNLRQLAEAIAEELRNLAVSASVGTVRGFADLTDEEIAEVDEKAANTDVRDLQRLLQQAVDAIDLVARTENLRFALELTLIQMCERPPLADAVAISEALARLDALCRGKPVPPPTLGGGGGGGPALRIAREALSGQGRAPAASQNTAAAPAPAPARAVAEAPASAAAPNDDAPMMDEPASTPAAVAHASTAPSGDGPAESPVADAAVDEATASVAPADEAEEMDAPFEPEPDWDADLPLEGIDERWRDFVDHVFAVSRRLGGHLENGHYLGSDGDTVRIAFRRGPHREAVEDAVQSNVITDALEVLGAGARLSLSEITTEADAPPSIAEARERAIAAAQAALEDHARAHPVVQKALELFGGEVRAVRRT